MFTVVAELKKAFRIGARVIQALHTDRPQDTATTDSRYTIIEHKRVMSQTGRKLKAAKKEFNEQTSVHAQRQCLLMCEKLFEWLPQELRNTIYDHFITENNATFYEGKSGAIKLANGSSAFQHCFDADFTGPSMHMEIIEQLDHRGTRFDFRHRHELPGRTLMEYMSVYGFDILSNISNVGLTLNFKDITSREEVFQCFEELFKLRNNAHIYVFIESCGNTQMQIFRSFRRIARIFVPFLGRLKQAGYQVTIVMNPSYAPSTVKNNAESRFSLIHEQDFRYSFDLKDAEFSTTGIERKLERVSFSARLHYRPG
jgi:hypothetical protein